MIMQIFQNDEAKLIQGASLQIVDTLVENYETMIDSMVGKSKTTKKTYKRNVCHFLAYIQANGINSHSYGSYRDALEHVGEIGAKTKNAYLSATKALLREGLKYGVLPVDITANVPQFKVNTGHTRDGLTEGEVNKVLSYIHTIKREVTRKKMLALFHLLAGEGLRQFEAQNILVEDIREVDNVIMIRGKGQDEKHPVLVMAATIEAVRDYIDCVGVDTGYIFPSPKDEKKPVSLRAIRSYWTHPQYGIFARAGISPDRSTHGFRHYFATKTLEIVGGDLHRAKRRTRHKTTATLQVYDDRRLTKNDMKEIEKAFVFAKPQRDTTLDKMDEKTAIAYLRALGVSYGKIAERLNNEGRTTARGNNYHATTVQRLHMA